MSKIKKNDDGKPNPYVRTFDEEGWQKTMTEATGMDEEKRRKMIDEVMDKHKADQLL